jgi:outer membrane lipoprotein carrier protein
MDLGKLLRRHPLGRLNFCRFLFVACAAVITQHLAAQTEGLESDLDGLTSLEQFLESTQTMRAEFQQLLWNSEGQLVEKAEGIVFLKRPNRFIWSYELPFEQQVVADGENLWIYDVDLDQVTVSPLDETIAATPAMLLSGGQGVLDAFEVLNDFFIDGTHWIELQPKHRGSDFSTIRLGFNSGKLLKLELVDGLNQLTEMEFSRLELNPELMDDLFDFTPPRDIAVIGQEANKD